MLVLRKYCLYSIFMRSNESLPTYYLIAFIKSVDSSENLVELLIDV